MSSYYIPSNANFVKHLVTCLGMVTVLDEDGVAYAVHFRDFDPEVDVRVPVEVAVMAKEFNTDGLMYELNTWFQKYSFNQHRPMYLKSIMLDRPRSKRFLEWVYAQTH